MECLDRDANKTHHNYVFTWDYDWSGGTPTNWHHSATRSRNDKRPWPAEFHQLRVADVNGDGCDEMIQGGYSVNPLKGWFQSPGIGHGDRYILSDIDPDRPGLEVYAIQQSALLGQLLYDARTAERIKEWYLPSVFDVGRGACMDVDASRKGYELYSFTDDYIYDCKGEKTSYTRSGCGIKTMFEGVWWNGDLQREELSSPGGSGWGTNMMITQVLNKARLIEFSQESSWATHGGTGTRPAFMGDITGDWREEIILPKQNDESCTGLVGYTTNIPTEYSIYCLQQDPHYRGDCTTRGYYQHPNTGFYLGGDMPLPPLPPVFTADVRNEMVSGKSVMFDLQGDNSSIIELKAPVSPTMLYLMNPRGHDYTFYYFGEGITGNGSLIKSMQGTVTFLTNLGYTGKTLISEGTLAVIDGSISGPVELRARGTLAGNPVLKDTIIFEGALNYEGCRLMPGEGQITSKKSVTLPGDVYLEVNAGLACPTGFFTRCDTVCGKLVVEGDLTFKNSNYVTVNLTSQDAAEYVIAECTGTLTCDPSQLKTRGLDGINYDLVVKDKQLVLVIHDSRVPAENVAWTGAESNLWNYKAQNFSLPAIGATSFVAGDAVVFNAQASQKSIKVDESMVTNGVSFDSGKYTLYGDGAISGSGNVTINKDADVTLNMKYSDYTGKTIINGGTLTVPNFYDSGQKSAIGASTAEEGNLQINGGTLVLSKDNMATDHIVTLTDTATIRVYSSNSSLTLKGQVKGTGYLLKDGPGRINFNYGGANNFAGVIVKNGAIAQGTWNSTFGKVGSPMLLAGGEVHQIDQNSTSTVPVLNHVITVQEGTTNRIVGSSRGKINGTIKGTGNLTIQTKYVRCDIGADFSQFEGKLTAVGDGGNFRLMGSVTDLSKATLEVGAGTTVSHLSSGGGSEVAATTRIGALTGTATDGVLGGSQSTYQIGYLNETTSFSGLLKAASIVKVGTGRLTLKTAGHTSPITVSGGTLEFVNTASTVMASGTVTVEANGLLAGTGLLQSVTVKKGGTVLGGMASYNYGALRLNGNLTLQSGATTLVRLGASTGNTRITVNGRINHNSDTLLVQVPAGRKLAKGDELVVYTAGFSGATGDVIVKCQSEDAQYTFDTSLLNSEGKIVVTDVTAISSVLSDEAMVDVFTVDGIQVRSGVRHAEAVKSLPAGVYVVGHRVNGKLVGRKVVR